MILYTNKSLFQAFLIIKKSIQAYEKVKFSRRDNSSLAIKGLKQFKNTMYFMGFISFVLMFIRSIVYYYTPISCTISACVIRMYGARKCKMTWTVCSFILSCSLFYALVFFYRNSKNFFANAKSYMFFYHNVLILSTK